MLFGSMPFKANTMFQMATLFKTYKGYKAPPRAKCSKMAIDMLKKLLTKDPKKRISA